MTTPPALLLVGHGNHDDSADALQSLIAELGRRNPELPVAGGLGKQSPPPLTDVVARLTDTGASQVVALPLTLGVPGGTVQDLRNALEREAEQHEDVSYACARPLGTEPALLRLLEQRLDEALGSGGRTPADRAATTVLLVGRGTSDPAANAELHRAARLLWEGSGYGGVETAFVNQAAPDVASGLDRCVALGARRVIVLPYFLFPGALPERVRLQTDGWAAVHPDTDVVTADVVGPGEALADLVEERYREAVAESSTLRCSRCGTVAGPGTAAGRSAADAAGAPEDGSPAARHSCGADDPRAD
ncbi:sirohydrochlorin chelatase [Streptomyces sp. TR06-5]|uniref:sirohydrochlorin chelatase n=1 Tax=Streptomyces sp. TR06-5 TaxID=3385976 RepID=UPI0039A3BFAB